MKFYLKLLFAGILLFSSCDKVDLTPINDKLDELEQRTEDLEALIKAHDELLNAQEKQIHVVSIANMDNGIELSMSDGTKIFVPSENSFTPYIGDNNHWWINGEDTGIKATGTDGEDGSDGTNGTDGKDGADGLTPYIGENGNWFIGNVDTGITASGKDGTNGTDGQDGINGQNGSDGLDAPKIISIQYINEEVIFHFSDGSKITLTMENAEEIQKEKDWKAVETYNGYILIEYNGTATNVVIPNTIYGKPVVSIGINGGDSDDYSIIPKKMRLLVSSIDFSEAQSLTSINDYALAGLSKITEITLPNSLLTINENSFDSCTELKTVTILKDTEPFTICKESSFSNTPIKDGTNESKIIYPLGTPYPTIDFWFKNNAEFYDSEGNAYGIPVGTEITEGDWTGVVVAGGIQLTLYSGSDKDVVVPNKLQELDVVKIGKVVSGWSENIFINGWQDYYSSIDMSNCINLKTIGHSAFVDGTNITSVKLAPNLEVIQSHAFHACSKLSDISFPESIESIETFAFYSNSITDLILPSNLKSIGYVAFENSYKLTSITFSENLEYVGEKAFAWSQNLTMVTIKRSETPLMTSFANSFENTPIIDGTDGATIYYPAGTNYPNEDGWARNQCNWVAQ